MKLQNMHVLAVFFLYRALVIPYGRIAIEVSKIDGTHQQAERGRYVWSVSPIAIGRPGIRGGHEIPMVAV
jgi:hypothetical protein